MKLCHMTGHRVGMITYVHIFGGSALQKFQRAKKSKIWLDFRQLLNFSANILRTNRDIKTWKQT